MNYHTKSLDMKVLINEIKYELNEQDQTAIVCSKVGYSGDIFIPEIVYYKNTPYTVTSIRHLAFSKANKLHSISIPNTVKKIGCKAFMECAELKSVNLSNSLTHIERELFSNCSSLTSIVIPEGVISIDEGAFLLCSSLTEISFPDSLEEIGEYAFRGCANLSSINDRFVQLYKFQQNRERLLLILHSIGINKII